MWYLTYHFHMWSHGTRNSQERERLADRDPVDTYHAPYADRDRDAHTLHQNNEQVQHAPPVPRERRFEKLRKSL